ncbi:discoidin domain-containing protein [Hymenobacter sp. UV11]|uniref:discoidin domain-containing protein n=1 Tax=Hymenobacter sp. UV11 TaxID=1849735 RepID=UPI00196A26B5|nr:discoidin domain-containing protein [Hymenobacter sp. UV11]
MLFTCLLLAASPAQAQSLALNKASIASSTVQASANAFDGNGTTRWESNSTDNEYIIVDLGSVQTIDRIRLTWENAYGKTFTLAVSAVTANPVGTTWSNVVNGSWTTVYSEPNNASTNNEYANLGSSGRYVRMKGTARATGYGYSLYEFEVFNYSNNTANNLALGKTGLASSTQGGFPAAQAFDNDNATRWGSTYDDNQWLYVDLKGEASISSIYLSWETAYGKDFRLETSEDASAWTTVSTFTGNTLHYNEASFATPVKGRYVRMYGVTRGTGYGFSLYEFQVYGTLTPLATTPIPMSNTVGPLPVTLTSFSATRQGAAVAVRWATATEHNSAGFDVQRSANGISFETLVTVAAAGNSQVTKAYAYSDATPLATGSYYRLRQVDLDGTVTYGPVAAVAGTSPAAALVEVFPNPVADQATLQWPATAAPTRWSLTTTTGQVLHAESILTQLGANAQVIDLRPYAAGSYILTVEAAGQVLSRTRVQKN